MTKVDHDLVSIVIPTYGRTEYLRRAIESILSQTYDNIEIIVVNDNSRESPYFDITNKIISDLDESKVVSVISQGVNQGGSVARNIGIENCKGQYIGFLDDDDFFYKNKIEKQIMHLKNYDLDVSICDMYIDNIKERKKNLGIARVGSISDFMINGNTYTPMILSKKQVLINICGFTDTPRFQDHLLMLKILGGGFKVGVLREMLFHHTYHGGIGITSKDNLSKGYKVRLREEKKYLHLLNRTEKRKYFFNVNLSLARVEKNDSHLMNSIKYLFLALCLVRSYRDFMSFMKRVLSVLVSRTSVG